MAEDNSKKRTAQRSDAGRANIDITKPNIARVYDYFVAGKDNFPADRESAPGDGGGTQGAAGRPEHLPGPAVGSFHSLVMTFVMRDSMIIASL